MGRLRRLKRKSAEVNTPDHSAELNDIFSSVESLRVVLITHGVQRFFDILSPQWRCVVGETEESTHEKKAAAHEGDRGPFQPLSDFGAESFHRFNLDMSFTNQSASASIWV